VLTARAERSSDLSVAYETLEETMEGENRTPDKTIGEVKFAKERAPAANDEQKIKQDRAAPRRQAPAGGDNRTPDKTIGEVEYAQTNPANPK